MKSNKVIGIPGYIHEGKNQSFGAGVNHLEFISQFGNPRIIMPWEKVVDLDMLYLPGGLDTAPSNYGEDPGYFTSNQDVHKEHFYKEKLDGYIGAGTPIFGVCLGAQMIAAKFGCRLVQNVLFHAQSKDRWATAHKVFPAIRAGEDSKKKNLVFNGFEYPAPEVNSHHHQAIVVSKLGERVTPLWLAENEDNHLNADGFIVEAFAIEGSPIVGVQWHPEELYDVFSRNVINQMLGLV